MFALMETLLAKVAPTWARYRKEQALLAPIEDVIRAEDNELLN
jgi:hypothetical protein